MPENRQAPKLNTDLSSNQSGHSIDEVVKRLQINDKDDGGAVVSCNPYPDRPGEPDCSYYLKTGTCVYGSRCRYNHPPSISNVHGDNYVVELPERVGEPDCEHFLKTGTCKYGSTCKYHHPRDRRGAAPISFNTIGLPMRHDEKPCPYYMRTGSCKFGVSCKFHHPQPAGSILPLTSTVVPSSTVPYVGAFPAWSLPRVSYVTGPNGLPVYVPPSQGILPVQGWNTYMGNVDPASPTCFLGNNLVYNPAIYGDPSSGGHTNLYAMSNLPERPDQPACRHFLSTGTCKYGSDCKFNHPKERVVQLLANQFSFPVRPGRAVCSYYRINGFCKYGSACKYDHPLMAHTVNDSFSQLSPSGCDMSLSRYPMRFSTSQHSESSLQKSPRLPESAQNQKPRLVRDKSQVSDAKTAEDPSNPACSESSHDSSP